MDKPKELLDKTFERYASELAMVLHERATGNEWETEWEEFNEFKAKVYKEFGFENKRIEPDDY